MKLGKIKNRRKRKKIYSICMMILFTVVLSGCQGSDMASNNSQSKDNKPDFKVYHNYISVNQTRYEDFKNKNADISDEDIVWMVNLDIDKENFEDAKVIDDPGDNLVLVNKHHKLPETYKPPKEKSVGNGWTMESEAADALLRLMKDAASEGLPMIPQSGYRSYAVQEILYADNKAKNPEGVDNSSARPGFSEHQTGLAMDLNIATGGNLRNFIGTKEADWVAANAYKYGFIVRYTEENSYITGYMAEPWHIRYLGVEHSYKMKEEKISSFEEYIGKYLWKDEN